jgi:hypothetical protein
MHQASLTNYPFSILNSLLTHVPIKWDDARFHAIQLSFVASRAVWLRIHPNTAKNMKLKQIYFAQMYVTEI